MKPVKDLFSNHSGDYARYRPSYPEELYNYLLREASGRTQAWDAGTGNGQVAFRLAEEFEKVLATDVSSAQLQQAPPHANINYLSTRAESCPLPDTSTDLITVGQALHWFSFNDFFNEVRRVLVPDGLLACFGYGLLTGPPALNPIIEYFYRETLKGCWSPERSHIETTYTHTGIPFNESAFFEARVNWDYADLLGYLSTWSAVKTYEKKYGQDPLETCREKIESALPEKKEIVFPVFLKTWRAGSEI